MHFVWTQHKYSYKDYEKRLKLTVSTNLVFSLLFFIIFLITQIIKFGLFSPVRCKRISQGIGAGHIKKYFFSFQEILVITA